MTDLEERTTEVVLDVDSERVFRAFEQVGEQLAKMAPTLNEVCARIAEAMSEMFGFKPGEPIPTCVACAEPRVWADGIDPELCHTCGQDRTRLAAGVVLVAVVLLAIVAV